MKSNQKPKETKATIEQISICKVQRRFKDKPFGIRIAGTRKMKSGRIESVELILSASESDIAYLFEPCSLNRLTYLKGCKRKGMK